MNSQGFLVSCLRRPPGWPLPEALFIVALVLLVLTLATCHEAPVAAFSPL
jgi:hypothetical protein